MYEKWQICTDETKGMSGRVAQLPLKKIWWIDANVHKTHSSLLYRLPTDPTQPPTVVCKMEAQLNYIHIAYTFFCTFGADLHAQLINKISASELSRKFIKSVMSVGYLPNPPPSKNASFLKTWVPTLTGGSHIPVKKRSSVPRGSLCECRGSEGEKKRRKERGRDSLHPYSSGFGLMLLLLGLGFKNVRTVYAAWW